jgi:hypothetical protein
MIHLFHAAIAALLVSLKGFYVYNGFNIVFIWPAAALVVMTARFTPMDVFVAHVLLPIWVLMAPIA